VTQACFILGDAQIRLHVYFHAQGAHFWCSVMSNICTFWCWRSLLPAMLLQQLPASNKFVVMYSQPEFGLCGIMPHAAA
jgi:hypothetical protein